MPHHLDMSALKLELSWSSWPAKLYTFWSPQLFITNITPLYISALKLQSTVILILLSTTCTLTRGGLRDEVKARAGARVSLRCAVNKQRCGDFHSIKWYKENRRVYVYSPVVDFSKVTENTKWYFEFSKLIFKSLIIFILYLHCQPLKDTILFSYVRCY